MKYIFSARNILVVLLATIFFSCKKSELEKRLIIHDSNIIQFSHPKKIVGELLDPTSPILVNDELIFSESGAGNVCKVKDGKVVPLITGFVNDNYGGYNISAQGITVEPESGLWIVCAAEGAGKIFIYDPNKFPIKASEGRQAELVGATEDNPWEAIVSKGVIIVSGGTKTQYQGKFDGGDPAKLFPVFSVQTGLIGITKHPLRDEFYGAEFGIPPDGGSIIKWSSTNLNSKDSAVKKYETISIGLHNVVDVGFTAKGTLLALEFGEFNAGKSGRLLTIDEKTRKSTPLLEGLNSPSSFTLDEKNGKIYISEFGVPANTKNGNLISLQYKE
jgi:hypothetical protein